MQSQCFIYLLKVEGEDVGAGQADELQEKETEDARQRALADMRSQWAEVAYCLSRAFWGRGIMTEALMAVIDFLIGKVGFLRIEAKHATENIASGRVMEKCGMQLEGVLRKGHRLLSTGELVDIAIRAILREEWEARKALQ